MTVQSQSIERPGQQARESAVLAGDRDARATTPGLPKRTWLERLRIGGRRCAQVNRQAEAEAKQSHAPILRLAAFFVSFGRDAGGEMFDDDGRLDLVAVL